MESPINITPVPGSRVKELNGEEKWTEEKSSGKGELRRLKKRG